MKNKVKKELLRIGVEKGYWTAQKKKITKKDLDKVYWYLISQDQSLSEEFIREFKDKVDWYWISKYQSLSEELIREFKDKVDWSYISQSQSLSEGFIREFKDKVYWVYISLYQSLSEDFIREFQDKVCWDCISRYQFLSDEFIKVFSLTVDKEDNWLYWTKEQKEKYIRDNTEYPIIDGKVVAFKSVKRNLASIFQPGLIYEIGKTYEAHCDCTAVKNSFGLSAWTKEGALNYYPKGKLLEVSIAIEDIGRIVHGNNKIRAKRITILEVNSKQRFAK